MLENYTIYDSVTKIVTIEANTLDAVSVYTITMTAVLTVNANPGVQKVFNPPPVTFTVTVLDSCATAIFKDLVLFNNPNVNSFEIDDG